MLASIGFDSLLVLGLSWPFALTYLDPGTGSLILQALLGAIAAMAVGVTAFWSRIKMFIGRRRHGGE